MILDVRMIWVLQCSMKDEILNTVDPSWADDGSAPKHTYGQPHNYPLRIDADLRAELETYAKAEGRSLNNLINRFIRNGLKKARS